MIVFERGLANQRIRRRHCSRIQDLDGNDSIQTAFAGFENTGRATVAEFFEDRQVTQVPHREMNGAVDLRLRLDRRGSNWRLGKGQRFFGGTGAHRVSSSPSRLVGFGTRAQLPVWTIHSISSISATEKGSSLAVARRHPS